MEEAWKCIGGVAGAHWQMDSRERRAWETGLGSLARCTPTPLAAAGIEEKEGGWWAGDEVWDLLGGHIQRRMYGGQQEIRGSKGELQNQTG